MDYKLLLDNIINKYNKKYKIVPTVDVQSYALSNTGIIVLDINSWKDPNLFFIFLVLHEIGHCETYNKNQNKVSREYNATQWAIQEFNKLNLTLPIENRNEWQEYIYSFTKEKDKNKYKLKWK